MDIQSDPTVSGAGALLNSGAYERQCPGLSYLWLAQRQQIRSILRAFAAGPRIGPSQHRITGDKVRYKGSIKVL